MARRRASRETLAEEAEESRMLERKRLELEHEAQDRIRLRAQLTAREQEGYTTGIVLVADVLALLAETDDLKDRLTNVRRQRDQARREATYWENRAKAERAP